MTSTSIQSTILHVYKYSPITQTDHLICVLGWPLLLFGDCSLYVYKCTPMAHIELDHLISVLGWPFLLYSLQYYMSTNALSRIIWFVCSDDLSFYSGTAHYMSAIPTLSPTPPRWLLLWKDSQSIDIPTMLQFIVRSNLSRGWFWAFDWGKKIIKKEIKR